MKHPTAAPAADDGAEVGEDVSDRTARGVTARAVVAVAAAFEGRWKESENGEAAEAEEEKLRWRVGNFAVANGCGRKWAADILRLVLGL